MEEISALLLWGTACWKLEQQFYWQNPAFAAVFSCNSLTCAYSVKIDFLIPLPHVLPLVLQAKPMDRGILTPNS